MPVPGRAVAIAALLAATIGGGILYSCDDVPITTVTFRVDDPWTFAERAMPLLVEIRGDSGEATAELVVGAMTEAISWHADPRLTTDPASAGEPGTRVVMTFNPASASGAEANCAGRVAGGAPATDGALRVLATFCWGGRALANVEGRLRRTGAGEARVAALVKQITLDLFQGQRHP